MTDALNTERSYTIQRFCEVEDFSEAKYHELQRLGLGPQETRIPHSNIVRITPEARRAWHQRLHELAQTEEAQLERRRRSELSSIAGKRAAASPLHISNRRRREREATP
jgi:hypothetical protein